MPGNKKGQATTIVILVSLFAIALLLASTLNALSWPFGPILASRSTPFPFNQSSDRGLLVINVTGAQNFRSRNALLIPGTSYQGNPNIQSSFSSTYASFPIADANFSVRPSNSQTSELINNTDKSGLFTAYLSPSQYQVRFLDSELGGMSVPIQVYAGNTTILTVLVNGTNYPISAYDLVDSDSSGLITNWESIFAHVDFVPQIGGGAQVFVQTFRSTSCSQPCSVVSIGEIFPITISSGSGINGSQWIMLHPVSILNYTGITNLSIVTYSTRYSVNVVNG